MQTIRTPRITRSETLTVVCAWCGELLVDGGPEVSHGLCEPCASGLARALPRAEARAIHH